MTPIDVGLAAAGWLAAAVERRTGSRRGTAAVVLGLVLLSGVITYSIGSSRRPTDVSFEDVRRDRLPAMTSWVRLEGELRQLPGDSGYELHDTANDATYLYVIAASPLEVGHVVMTGRISPRQATSGNIGSFVADIPAEPKRNEPFGLILLPAALGVLIVAGRRIGYPVVRHERARIIHAPPLAAGEPLAPAWSGRIGSQLVAHGAARPCTLTVVREPEFSILTLRDGTDEHTIRARRAVPANRLRVCRLGGCQRGLEIHAQTADLVLAFTDPHDRDRLANTLR